MERVVPLQQPSRQPRKITGLNHRLIVAVLVATLVMDGIFGILAGDVTGQSSDVLLTPYLNLMQLNSRATSPGPVVCPGTSAASPESIAPNDLWAIHDLLLVGAGAVFMKGDSEGKRQIEQHAFDLANLLPQLHPHQPCRGEVATALLGEEDKRRGLIAAAEAAWACLPARFSDESFINAFTAAGIGNDGVAFSARNPKPRNADLLCACRGSGWPRACSYWASLHTMAYRADVLNLGKDFIQSVVPLIAGGALQCGSCTEHFRMLMPGSVLGTALQRDFGNVY